jgi:hypothetical protein
MWRSEEISTHDYSDAAAVHLAAQPAVHWTRNGKLMKWLRSLSIAKARRIVAQRVFVRPWPGTRGTLSLNGQTTELQCLELVQFPVRARVARDRKGWRRDFSVLIRHERMSC